MLIFGKSWSIHLIISGGGKVPPAGPLPGEEDSPWTVRGVQSEELLAC